ncbi:MAG: carbon storage regulator [Pirellulaceae bacterium]|nr:carbon storage regulator [Pirellulaceae bacterium]
MLVLTRKPGEQLVIDNNITITICKSGPNRVTVGIDAPKEVPIRRGELVETRPKQSAGFPLQSCDSRVAAKPA